MRSQSLKMALQKFNEANEGSSEDQGFEVLNFQEASLARGGVLDCTCNNGSSYTKPTATNCTCNNGSSYAAA